jgi:triosephosphate isomerase (TIM)
MMHIFVNLKRFDVPRRYGGLCDSDDPPSWIADIVRAAADSGIAGPELRLVFLLPESLVHPAVTALRDVPQDRRTGTEIGVQGVFRNDVSVGGNFGAFTTGVPATAARNLGADWAILGHSEERRDKFGIVAAYDQSVSQDGPAREKALAIIDQIVGDEIRCALQAQLRVLFCIGESEQERGGGSFDEQAPRVRDSLRRQIRGALDPLADRLSRERLVIGYEPIWAIGPGKTPPDRRYISFVSEFIRDEVSERFGFTPNVVYGGGVKRENAEMLGSIPTLNGGLIALTRFTQPIAFDVDEMVRIVERYVQSKEQSNDS